MASAEADVQTMDSSIETEQFMASPLVTWFQSCLSSPERLDTLDDLMDGMLIHEVILLIQPDPEHKGIVVPSHNDPLIRIRNMVSNVQNVRAIYENDLFQTILVCPDPVVLAGADVSEGGGSKEEQCSGAMHLMLLLLLGAAVQGPSKESFIEAIKQLPLDCQHSIVDCIKQVTNSQELVLTQEWGEVMGVSGEDVVVPELLASHVVRLAKERDAYLTKWTKSILKEENSGAGVKGDGPECEGMVASRSSVTPSSNGSGKEEDATREKVRSSSHHQSTVAISVEVSELKARIRRLRQELEERTETLGDCREELKQSHSETSALRRRVIDLTEKAREYATYQDELDALRERAVQADQMEEDIRRYKERLRDMEVYRAMVDELREDNRVLQETKDLLEDQLSAVRPKAEKASQLQSEVNCVRREMMDLKMEREAEKVKAMELGTEAMRVKLQVIEQLREALKSEHRTKGGRSSDGEMDEEEEGGGVENRSLSDQLSRQAEARVLRLELENSRLTAELEAKKQEMDTEVASRVDALQGENKRLSMKVEQLQEESGWWNSEREQLEAGLQEALVERRRLQNSLDSAKEANKVHVEERQLLQAKLDGRDQSLREIRSENQRLTDEIRKLQAEEERKSEEVQKARDKVASLQREVTALLREISKLKEDLEAKEVSVEQLVCQGEVREDEMQEMTRKIEDMQALVNRLQDVEREVTESQRKALEDQEALATLQGDLVQEKTKRQIFHNLLTQVESALLKIGVEMPWNLAEVEVGASVDPDLLIDRIKCSEEVQRIVKETMSLVEAPEPDAEADDVGMPVDGMAEEEGAGGGGDSVGGQPPIEASAEKVRKLEEEVCGLQQELKTLREERERGAAKMVAGVTQEVEIATLHSRIQSLTDQHTALHLANSQLVAEKDELVRELEREQSMRKLLLQSQEKLDCLHNDLTSDYEHVARERDVARAEARAAKVDAEACGKALLQLKEVLQAERNTMHTTTSSLANLRDEHSRLKEDFRWVYSVAEKQKAEIKALKLKNRALANLHHVIPRAGDGSQQPLSEMRREGAGETCVAASDERARLEAEVLMLRDMNAQLIEERRSLMNHASKLLNECHGLFSHSLEDKQHFHKEERAFMDRVNDLKRQKEKLEEKIMELYRSSESSSKKKSFGANLVKKVRKAGSDFISKVPRGGRTWHRDGHRSLSHSNVLLMSDVASGSGGDEDDDRGDEEGSSGNGDWDASAQSSAMADTDALLPTPAAISFGGAGSRQGVYYTGAASDKSPQKHAEGDNVAQSANTADVDVPSFTPNDDAAFHGSSAVSGSDHASSIKIPRPSATKSPAPPPPSATPKDSGRSLLVYNRITANIGLGVEGSSVAPTAACTVPPHRVHPGAAGDDVSSLPPSDENEPQWYEFGCV